MKLFHAFIVKASCVSIAIISAGCGLAGKQAGVSLSDIQLSAGGGSSPLGVFQSGFYQFATSSGTSCIQCHGASQAPLFAVGDVGTACNNITSYVNFASPSTSPLAIYAGNGHCGIASVCGSNTAAVAADITTWGAAMTSAGTSACSNAGVGGAPPPPPPGSPPVSVTCPVSEPNPAPATVTHYLTPMPIPATLSATGTAITWTISATNLVPAEAAAVGETFTVLMEYNGTNYVVLTPKLTSPTVATNVVGVHVLINTPGLAGYGCELTDAEVWSTEASATGVNTTVGPSATAATLSPLQLQIPAPTSLTGNTISIGFETFNAP